MRIPREYDSEREVGEGAEAHHREARVPGRRTLTEGLSRMGAGEQDQHDRPMSDAPIELPMGLRAKFERSLGTDLGGVRVHAGDDAARMAAGAGARALAVGQDIAFGAGEYAPDSPTGEHLLAHEVAHAAQQGSASAGARFKLMAGGTGDGAEVEADRAADAMVAGLPSRVSADSAGVARLQPLGAPSPSAPASRGPASGAAASSDPAVDQIDRVVHAPDPIAGPQGFVEAWGILNALPIDRLLRVVPELDRRGILEPLFTSAEASLASSRLRSVRAATLIVHGKGGPNELGVTGALIGQLSSNERDSLWQYFEAHYQGALGSDEAFDIVAASSPVLHDLPPEIQHIAVEAIKGGGKPLDWGQKEKEPFYLYIGNSAHDAIALAYRAAHGGDSERIFTNRVPIKSILARGFGMTQKPPAVTEPEFKAMPDILDAARLFLYEIKPWTGLPGAIKEALWYQSIFTRAGVPIQLGPQSEPGTRGVIPAPGGFFAFGSPAPGAIVYQWGRGIEVPARRLLPVIKWKRVAMAALAAATIVVVITMPETGPVLLPALKGAF